MAAVAFSGGGDHRDEPVAARRRVAEVRGQPRDARIPRVPRGRVLGYTVRERGDGAAVVRRP